MIDCIEDVKNRDITVMTNEELLAYKKEVTDALEDVDKIKKVGLKKILYTVGSYIGGGLLGVTLAEALIGRIYGWDFFGVILPRWGTILFSAAVIAVPWFFYKKAKKDAGKLRTACLDKIDEINRQISLNDFKAAVEEERHTATQGRASEDVFGF